MNAKTHAVQADLSNEELMLDSLLNELNDDEIIEGLDDEMPVSAGAVEGVAHAALPLNDDELLSEVEDDIKTDQAKKELYASQELPAVAPGEIPGEKSGKKGKKKKADAAAKEPKPAKEPKEPKAPVATSVNTKPGDLLKLRLGANLADYLTFDIGDAEDAAEAKRLAFIEKMNDRDAIADKVREKVLQFFGWLTNSGSKPNEVIRRAIVVLHETGELTSGDKGNLQLNLLEKPYSIGTARSQANQIFMLFPLLEMTLKEKGKMVPNPNSPILMAAKSALGL